MSGKTKPERLPMYKHPFTLLCNIRYNEEGNPVFKRPLWLIVIGARRHELTLEHIYQAYSCCFDLAHLFTETAPDQLPDAAS